MKVPLCGRPVQIVVLLFYLLIWKLFLTYLYEFFTDG